MLELYHSVNSVCAQKVRIVIAEKGLEYREHLMTLRGDQFDEKYMKLNPNAVVPTIVHELCTYSSISLLNCRTRARRCGSAGMRVGGLGNASSM